MQFLKPMILICALHLFFVPLVMAAESDSDTDTENKSGIVAEKIDVDSYVYLRLDEQESWIAAPPFDVAEGDKVEYSGGMEMRNFYSKSLNRTFESIYFIQNIVRIGQDVDNIHRTAKQDTGTEHTMISKPVSVKPPVAGEIPALTDGITIGGIFDEMDELNGQVVSFRARVIKVSENVMGKNWVTLQDGTGAKPANQLLATSTELVAAGDLVIASGIFRKDIDIGSGYKYAALLEEATFSQGSD